MCQHLQITFYAQNWDRVMDSLVQLRNISETCRSVHSIDAAESASITFLCLHTSFVHSWCIYVCGCPPWYSKFPGLCWISADPLRVKTMSLCSSCFIAVVSFSCVGAVRAITIVLLFMNESWNSRQLCILCKHSVHTTQATVFRFIYC